MEQPIIDKDIIRFIEYNGNGNDFFVQKNEIKGVMLSGEQDKLYLHIDRALYVITGAHNKLYDIYSDILLILKFETYNDNNISIDGCSLEIKW